MKKCMLASILTLSLIFMLSYGSNAVVEAYGQVSQEAITAYENEESDWPPRRTWNVGEQQATVQVDGEFIMFYDQWPIIDSGRTLVPVRGVFEHMGFRVDWNPETEQVTLTSDDYVVILTIGSSDFTTNGINYTLDVPAQIIWPGRTMLPARAILESVGYYVSWDSRLRTVLVSSLPITYVTIQGEQFSTALTTLSLTDMSLTNEDIVLLSGLTNLKELNLDGMHITDITPLSNLTNLMQLSLIQTQISDLAPLSNLANLRSLTLSHNQVLDISSLPRLTNLNRLTINGVTGTDISSLSGLTGLVELSLIGGNISDISPLSGLTNLEDLSLWSNQINDLTPLSNLTNLTVLNLSNNPIRDISPLANLTNLAILSLWDTQITDWSPLAHMEWVNGRPDNE